MVAAQHDEHEPALLDVHGKRLQQRALGQLEQSRDRRDAASSGGRTSAGAGSGAGSSTGCAWARATSTLAA